MSSSEQGKRTEISTLGEFGLIDRISKRARMEQPGSVLGIGDDAAVIDVGDHYQLVSTDMLVEGVHFDLSYVPLHHLGYKAVAVNVSDIAAMNGQAQQITVSIAISNRFSTEAIDALYEGISLACEAFGVDLIGGDTTSSPSGLVISITAIGKVDKQRLAKRSGAAPGDIICVTGDLGGAYIGLQVLEREKQVYLANPQAQPDLEKYTYVVQRQLKPEARMDIIHELSDLGVVPSAMIDVSDGLGSELFHLKKHNDCGFHIFEDKLPIDAQTYDTAVEFKIDPTVCVLNGGEDYELLFTIRQADFEKVKNHPDIHFIGYLTADKTENHLVTKGGQAVPVEAQGWQHF